MRSACGWCSAVECGWWWWWWRGGGRERGGGRRRRPAGRGRGGTARDGWGTRFFDCSPPSSLLLFSFLPVSYIGARIQMGLWVFLDGFAPAASGNMSILFPYLPAGMFDGFGKLSGFVVGSSSFSEENHGQEWGERDVNCRFILLFVNIVCFDAGSIWRSC